MQIYRKGSINAQFDLGRGLVRWRESNRWNRNFLRTLSPEDAHEVVQVLISAQVLDWPAAFPDQKTLEESGPFQHLWSLELRSEDNELIKRSEGKDVFPQRWEILADSLSQVLRRPLKVID